MLRRSLILFLAFLLLGLGLTAGYALLNLRGPDDAIAEAQALLRRGDATGAVRILDLCEPGAGMRENAELLRQLWRLRLDANRRLDNPVRALSDIDKLLGIDGDDVELQLTRLYYLLRESPNEATRQYALDFVAKHPTMARGQELAGEACQLAYKDRLVELNKQLRGDLGFDRTKEGIAAFLEFLYRPDGDEGGLAALLRLQQLYEHEPRFRQAWPKLQENLRGLRERVQQGLGFFLRSLELAQHIKNRTDYYAAAYRGASFALRQADRRDDVVAQAEIYLTNFDHRYCSEAAIDAANAHIRDELWEAAVEVADRFLPLTSWSARRAAGKIDDTVQELLIAKSIALYHLGRDRDLEQLALEATKMATGGLRVGVIPPLAGSFTGLLHKHPDVVLPQLVAVTEYFQSLSAPLEGDDPLDLLMPLRLQLTRASKAPPTTLVDIAAAWGKKRPGTLEPLRARARMQLLIGQGAAAMSTAEELLLAAPTDEPGLRLLGEAADLAYRDSSQDSDSLLLQCIDRGTGRPDFPPQPVCLLLCAEAALRHQRPDIARVSARAGSDAFPWSVWPRLIEARAEIEAGNIEAAIAVLTRMLDRQPDNAEALALWFDISQRAGLPMLDHLPAVVCSAPDSAAIATALLGQALADHSPATTSLARAAIHRSDATAELLALAAQAFARAMDVDAATSALQQARTLAAKTPTALAAAALTMATIDAITAMAGTMPDDRLIDAAATELQRTSLAGPTTARSLLDAAVKLRQLEHPRTAFLLTSTALALGDAIEWRDADSFTLAGDCALASAQVDAAAANYTAAMSFPDGGAATEPLARIELVRGNRDRAVMAMELLAQPTDAALALLAAQSSAAELAQRQVRADGSDLLAAIPFALSSQVDDQVFGAELRQEDGGLRSEVLALTAILAEPQLAGAALLRARALVATLPASRAAALLLARACRMTGNGAEAAAIHGALFAAGCRDLPLFGECARAAGTKDYVLAEPIRTELRLRTAKASDALPPVVLAFTLRDIANAAATTGDMPSAARILLELWQRYPEISKAAVADARLLLQYGLVVPAATLLDHLRHNGNQDTRREATTAYYGIATQASATLPAPAAQALRTAALADLDAGVQVGPPLAFLLADPRRLAALAPVVVRRHLATLLKNAAVGADDYDVVPAALAYSRSRLGDEDTLALLEEVIAAHPAMAPYWLERARLLADRRTARTGLEAARHLLAYVDDPQLTIEFTVLAGMERAVTPGDGERLQRLPATALATPLGQFAGGLVELRRGNGDRAQSLLVNAPPQASGFHLYALALANLMRRAPDAKDQARQLFQQLADDYASSSLARNAGNFARQLSPN